MTTIPLRNGMKQSALRRSPLRRKPIRRNVMPKGTLAYLIERDGARCAYRFAGGTEGRCELG